MEQYLEFAGNHPFLIGAFVVTLGMLVFVEVQRVMGGARDITPGEAVRLQNNDGVFLDIRDAGEYRAGHLLEARNMPLKEFADRVSELEKFKDRPLIAYCGTGARAGKACAILKKQGFRQVYSIAGGLQAWEKANLPLEKK